MGAGKFSPQQLHLHDSERIIKRPSGNGTLMLRDETTVDRRTKAELREDLARANAELRAEKERIAQKEWANAELRALKKRLAQKNILALPNEPHNPAKKKVNTRVSTHSAVTGVH